MDYLGTLLSADGHMESERGRRIGCARADLNLLHRVWGHSTLSTKRKIALFSSLIESKLLYGLSCACLAVPDRRRLDGFQARCLRRILKIPPPYYSRVSNNTVLQRAGHTRASTLLLRRQLTLLRKILRAPSASPLKFASLIGSTLVPATSRYVRRVGHPRREWIPTVLAEGLRVARSSQRLEQVVQTPGQWKSLITRSVT